MIEFQKEYWEEYLSKPTAVRKKYPMWLRQNKAVRPWIPAELGPKLAQEIFTMKYVETLIKYREYERWMDLLNGAMPGLLMEFYVSMVQKYVPNYFYYGMLLYINDLEYDQRNKQKI